MSSSFLNRLRPWSFGTVVVLTGLSGLCLLAVAIWSFASHSEDLGISVGTMVAMYAVIILGITVAAWRRFAWSWGLLVGVALLNGFTASDFIRTEDPFQFWLSLVWLIVCIVSAVAALLPGTRLALDR